MRKIGINAELGFGIPAIEMLPLIRNAGFDAVFVSEYPAEELVALRQRADELGLEIPFVHASFSKIERVWEDDPEGDAVIDRLIDCVDKTAAIDVPVVICHVYKGFGKEEIPTELGIRRFVRLLDHAQARGIRIAFENTEGDPYLEAIRTHLWEHPATAFCFDSGHEVCYNRSRDLLATFGDRLVATHLDDNLGIKGESIFWHDDLHLLPWDGVVDFEGVARRIQKTGFDGTLMFELTVKSKPERHENDVYREMGCEAYLKLAHERAVRFAKLFE